MVFHSRRSHLLLTFTWLIIGRCICTNTSSATNEESIREVLAKFERGDPGWKVRMESLAQAVRAGADAVPVLAESLDTGVAPVREFAAHALSMIADPRSEPALTKALDDPDRGVRIYAVRALSGLRKLRLTEAYRTVMTKASTTWPKAPWMDDYLLAAQDPQHSPNPPAKRTMLLEYELSQMDSASVGRLAPDFVLHDRNGNEVRLSDFRGKSAIVLEFNDGAG